MECSRRCSALSWSQHVPSPPTRCSRQLHGWSKIRALRAFRLTLPLSCDGRLSKPVVSSGAAIYPGCKSAPDCSLPAALVVNNYVTREKFKYSLLCFHPSSFSVDDRCVFFFVFFPAAFLTQTVCLDDTTVKFEIWDTAGQERYHSLAPMYYRGAQAAIVVYDITNTVSHVTSAETQQAGPVAAADL